MRQSVSLAAFAVLTALIAVFAAQFEPGAWYAGLIKPSWTPPNAIFGPVWTVLYVSIAVTGWLLWNTEGAQRPRFFWFAGLLFNGLWSYVFFGAHEIGWALLDIALLWLSILALIVTAWSRSRAAALLAFPYLAWVSYAGLLNAAIWQLNP